MRGLRLFVLAAALLAAAPARAEAPPIRLAALGPDVLDRFHAWLERLRKGKESIENRREEEVRTIISDLRTTWAMDPLRETDIATALLDFLGWCTPAASLLGPQSRAGEAHDLALDALRAHVDPEFTRWMTREVLAVRSQPVERRTAALAVLAKDHGPALLLPLLSCAREDDPRIRIPALEQLVGWDDGGVHGLFLDELARGDAARGIPSRTAGAWWLAEAHFGKVALPPLSPYAVRLAAIVERGLSSSDWREVSRAVSLSRPLAAESVIPFLIEALRQWKAREEAGAQALRIEMEIVRALENRSGRKLGLHPSEWSAWWKAFSRGELKGAGPQTGQYKEGTQPGFFGLHPETDRVTFVIDRSGSMDTPLVSGTGFAKRTRWGEAVEQLLGFLDGIGPRARFGVILFHEYPEEWRPTLLDATPENKKAVRAWLTGNSPGGGTALEGAIARAMRIGPDGNPDLAVLETDTIIVLCDGETAEGPGWVDPFLHGPNQRARVVFHCVQIGDSGDQTLQKLATGSGGDFVKVDG